MNKGLTRKLRGVWAALAATAFIAWLMIGQAPADTLTTVTFGTDWKAEAEHGGYYQAIAAGIYKKYGLDVELRQGGPQVNHFQPVAAGVLDFNLASNSFRPV